MNTYGWEPVWKILGEPNIAELIGDYWEELSPIKEVAPLAPDFDRMMTLDHAGLFKAWCARSEGGLLLGFIGFYVMPHLNYRHTLFAFDNGHYLHPDHRGGWTGVHMWRGACDALRELGVKVVIAHDNALRPLEPLFKRLGFQPRGALYWRAL
jgi:L-amino acid N-acyltransferase YncA